MQRTKTRSSADALIKESVNKLYPVLVITAISLSLTTLTDNLCASSFIGVAAVAAIGIVTPLIGLLWGIVHIIAKGGQIVAGRKLGKNELTAVVEIFNISILLIFFIGLLCMVLIFMYAHSLAYFLGASDELMPYVRDYIRGLALYVPIFLVYETVAEFLPFEGGEKFLLGGIVAITTCNALFNLVFIVYFDWGMFGLGLASAAAALAGLLSLLPFFFRQNRCIVFKPSFKGSHYLKESVVIGIPGGYFEMWNFVLPVCINHLMMRYAGIEAVSAMSVAGSIRYFMKSFIFAEGDICTAIGSVCYGEKDEKSLMSVVRYSLTVCFIYYGVVAFGIILFVGPIISGLAGGSPQAEALAYPAIMFTLLQLILLIINLTFMRVYQLQGKKGLVSLINFFAFFIIPLCYGLVLIPLFGAWGLWVSWPITNLTVLLLIYVLNVKKQHKLLLSASDFFTYGEHFAMPAADRLSMSITDSENIVAASKRVTKFCLDHNLEEKKALHSGLMVEELCLNIIEHGYTGRHSFWHRGRYINLTVFFQHDSVHLCIRDNGKQFNPAKYMRHINKSYSLEDLDTNLGLRIVASLAHKVSYKNLFHMNIVDVEI